MYKVLIANENSQISEYLNVINKENGHISFINNDEHYMYIIYEVTDYRSDIDGKI